MRIDFVSDITCPWCAIALRALEQAIERIADAVPVQGAQPFEAYLQSLRETASASTASP